MFTKFNRVLLASGLILTSLVGFSSSAFAEGLSGEANVNNEVFAVLSYEKALTAPGYNLLTGGASDQTLVVGSVNIKSNDPQGFIVGVLSSNAEFLKTGAGGDTEKIEFTLQYGSETAIEPTTTDSPLATMDFDPLCADYSGCDEQIKVIIPTRSSATGVVAGTYTTNLTFSITSR
jgi:hypothetical protein